MKWFVFLLLYRRTNTVLAPQTGNNIELCRAFNNIPIEGAWYTYDHTL